MIDRPSTFGLGGLRDGVGRSSTLTGAERKNPLTFASYAGCATTSASWSTTRRSRSS